MHSSALLFIFLSSISKNVGYKFCGFLGSGVGLGTNNSRLYFGSDLNPDTDTCHHCIKGERMQITAVGLRTANRDTFAKVFLCFYHK